MKLLLTLSLLVAITACSPITHSTSVVGTIVSVSKTEGKACGFGEIQLKTSDNSAGELVEINFSTFSEAMEAEAMASLNKPVVIKVTTSVPMFGCNTEVMTITKK